MWMCICYSGFLNLCEYVLTDVLIESCVAGCLVKSHGGRWWSCVSHDGNECGAIPKLSQQSLTKRKSVILCRVAELTYSHNWNVEFITIASTPRRTHMTGKNKQSCKFPETQHTSQNITHSHLSAEFFCSLSPFSFILFHSVQVGAICALAKPLTWMALSVSVWLRYIWKQAIVLQGHLNLSAL